MGIFKLERHSKRGRIGREESVQSPVARYQEGSGVRIPRVGAPRRLAGSRDAALGTCDPVE